MSTQTTKITLDAAALFAGKAVGLLLGVVRLSYFASYLGVEQFGLLNFAAYFVLLFQSLFDLGIAQLLTREIARETPRSRSLLGQALLLKAAIGILSAFIVFIAVAASRFDAATNEALALTTIAQIVNSLSLTFLSAFQAHRKMALVSTTTVVSDVLLSGLVIVILPQFPSVRTTLLLTNLVAIFNFAMLWLVYRRIVGAPHLGVDWLIWRRLLREGLPMAVSAFGISIYMYIGPTALPYLRPKEEIGLFSAGYKLISILTLIPAAVSQVVYPIFSQFAAQAPEKLQKSLRDALRVMLEISVPLAVGTIVLAPRIMELIFPPAYAAGAIVLQLIIAGNAVGYLAWILTTFLLSIGRQSYCMLNSLSVAVLVAAASFVLIPPYGFVAVAAIIALTEVVLFISMATYAWRRGYRSISLASSLKILLASALMGLVLRVFSFLPLLILVVCGILVYGVLILLFRVIGDQEREMLSKILGLQVGKE